MSDTIGQIPRVHSGGTVDEFFDRLEKKADSLVTWYGELYFELHRGVYTTQANTKSCSETLSFLQLSLLFKIALINIPKRRLMRCGKVYSYVNFMIAFPEVQLRCVTTTRTK
jgi:alpha-mannosidase